MSDESIAIYVHVPFCQAKCHYCDFASFAGLGHLTERYVAAVCTEAEGIAGRHFGGRQPKARSIYFGGGTPSLLQPAHVERLLAALPRPVTGAEITLEANPATLDAFRLRSLRSLGVARLSLGVQCFDDELLRRLGRLHSAAEAVASYDMAREAGFEEISLDLIFGLPGQNLEAWRSVLRRAIELRPEHLSLYGLTVEEGTVFGRLHAAGKLVVPSEDEQADMYLLAQEMLNRAGYEQYEISNWARRDGALVRYARHNLVYWRNEPYLGLGPAAHSCLGGRRFSNTPNVRAYISAMEARGDAVNWHESVDRETEMAETMMLGLRLVEGVAFERFEQRFGCRLEKRYEATIAELAGLGLLAVDDRRVALTERGRLLGNEVFGRFLMPRTT